MIESLPGDTFSAIFTGLATGLSGGFQIQRASNGTVVAGRTTVGVAERPPGAGVYVVTSVAPVEGDTYLIIFDWDSGNLTPTTSRVEELRVSTTITVAPSGLGLVADAAKSHMGQTFDRLVDDEHYGAGFIGGRVSVVKRRTMNTPPAVVDEDTLDELVIDYLGKLVTLELMPAAYDYWASQYQSQATGQDPTETVSYPDRIKSMEKVQETILSQVRRDEALVLPLIEGNQRLRTTTDGPSIDEDDDCHVTQDPRGYPSFKSYPTNGRRPTGVNL